MTKDFWKDLEQREQANREGLNKILEEASIEDLRASVLLLCMYVQHVSKHGSPKDGSNFKGMSLAEIMKAWVYPKHKQKKQEDAMEHNIPSMSEEIREEVDRQALEELEKVAASKPDLVNHPPHYTMGIYEVIDVIFGWKLSFCLGNAVKYIARAKHKGNMVQDLEKAVFYLDYERKNTDPTTEDPLCSDPFAVMVPLQAVILDWKLDRSCGTALRAIYAATHKDSPHTNLGLAAANLCAAIQELQKKNSK